MEAVAIKIKDVLDEAWQGNFTTKSDFARTEADWIALAASFGYITVLASEETWTRYWMITEEGLGILQDLNVILEENEP